MKLLLDTHTFIWWDSAPHKIPEVTAALLKQPTNEVLLSVVSLWEIQIKAQLGKLSLRGGLSKIVDQQLEKNDISLLPIKFEHILELEHLPFHHKDPFDRLLIAQGRIEKASIISCDRTFAKYECNVVWRE